MLPLCMYFPGLGGLQEDACDARLRTKGLPEHGSWCPATHQA